MGIGTTSEMNKLILCGSLFLSLLLLLPSTSGEKATGEILSDLCAKCNYCTTENADYAREKKQRRDVWRGVRKDAGLVQARMETGLIVARREENKICHLSLLLNIKLL